MLVLAGAIALAVGVLVQRRDGASPRPIAWRDLTPQLAGVELPDPARRVFRVPAALRDFQRETSPGVPLRQVPLDWRREELVLVAPGPRSSTGYGVRVVGVTERDRRIDVVVRETSPSLGQRVEPRVTYPYRLLALPQSHKRIAFVWQGQ